MRQTQTHRPTRALATGALAACLALGGCYAAGRKVPQETLLDLVPGATTCAEVRQRYGPPTSATLASGRGEQLIYAYSQGQVDPKSFIPIAGSFLRSSHSEMTTVTFECDVRGVLQTYTSTQGQDTVGTGFSSGARQ